MRYIKIDTEERELLLALKNNNNDKLSCKRSHCLLLSSEGFKINELTKIFAVSRRTIERWFDGWEKEGYDSLSMKKGRGAKKLLNDYKKEIKRLIEEHNRNLKPIIEYLKKEYNISICKRTLQNFLKDTGI